ncbi:LXG domain-containing protein [Pontibacillus halophilus]|uniref:LXG domain-containing protein n=1 Tax=Pontibacillus halophilus TaxID=516704 RepID=UPI001378C584|nr:LXG domain-containing protein [Pontibacillus halophilus]
MLDVSIVIDELDKISNKRESEKEQVLTLKKSMDSFIGLESSLKGSGGNAIRAHFAEMQVPLNILLQQFQDKYIETLGSIKDELFSFESREAFLREDFMTNDVQTGLEKVDKMTTDLIEGINDDYVSISDLVPFERINLTDFSSIVEEGKEHIEDTTKKLIQVDKSCVNLIEDAEATLDQLSSFVTKMQTWTKDGVFLSDQEYKELEKFYNESNVMKEIIENAEDLSDVDDNDNYMNQVANMLEMASKTTGVKDVIKNSLGFAVLSSGMLKVIEDGKGNLIIKASAKWKQGSNGKYVCSAK